MASVSNSTTSSQSSVKDMISEMSSNFEDIWSQMRSEAEKNPMKNRAWVATFMQPF